jgi:hypothetical protein
VALPLCPSAVRPLLALFDRMPVEDGARVGPALPANVRLDPVDGLVARGPGRPGEF